jgi:hypothetical protein
MKNNDTKLIWEAYLQLDESLSAAEALNRMRGAIAAGYEDLIPDILDAVDTKDKPALVKKAKMLGIHHIAFNPFVPPAGTISGGRDDGKDEEYPSSAPESTPQAVHDTLDRPDVDSVLDQLVAAIENLEPAGDVMELYHDALKLGAEKFNREWRDIPLRLSKILEWALEKEYLTEEEIQMIQKGPPGLEHYLSNVDGTPGFKTDDVHFWEALYHEMWWEHIERSATRAATSHKKQLEDRRPEFKLVGPKKEMIVEFHEVKKVDIQTGKDTGTSVLLMFERRIGDQMIDDPSRLFQIFDYSLEDVKEWWAENWNFMMSEPDRWEEEDREAYEDEDKPWRDDPEGWKDDE